MFGSKVMFQEWFLNCCAALLLFAILGFIARTPAVSNLLFPIKFINLESPLSEVEMEAPDWPTTTTQAVMLIAEELTDGDKSAIATLRQRDMTQYHHGLGTYVRNRFGLWRGNMELLDSTGTKHPDDASQVILEQLNTHLVRISN